MTSGRFQFPFLASAVCALMACSAPAQGQEGQNSTPPPQKVWQAELPDQPTSVKKHNHKLISMTKNVAKGLGKELGTSITDMGKDAALVFSVQGIDPYDEKAPKNEPYRLLDMQLVDGTTAYVVKYPDGSGRIQGGFADGTVLIPNGNEYLVKYPNGAQGRLDKSQNGVYTLYRPDNTTTTFKKEDGGSYSITNSKIGYMGDAVPDETGLNYNFQ